MFDAKDMSTKIHKTLQNSLNCPLAFANVRPLQIILKTTKVNNDRIEIRMLGSKHYQQTKVHSRFPNGVSVYFQTVSLFIVQKLEEGCYSREE